MMKQKIHYAWFVCLGCALLLFCTSGLSVNTFTIYQPYIIERNGFSGSQSSLIITVRNLFSFAAMLGVQAYYRRFSRRTGMLLAGLMIALGFVLFGLAGSLGGYCLAAAVTGLGYGLGTMIPITVLLSEWFVGRRGTAIALCSSVTGLSTLGIPSLLARSIKARGLRVTFLIEAAVIAGLVFCAFLLIRNAPDGAPYGGSEEQKAKLFPDRGIGGGDWLLIVPAILLIGAVMNVSYSHMTVHMTAEGYTPETAALAVAVSGIVLTLSKILYGRLCDRFTAYRCNYLFAAVLIAGMGLFCLIGRSAALLYASTAMMSAGLSCTAVGLSVWAGDLSDSAHYAANVQRFQLLYSAGTLIFSPFPGIIADRCGGSYIPAYALFAIAAVFVMAAVQRCYIRVAKQNR